MADATTPGHSEPVVQAAAALEYTDCISPTSAPDMTLKIWLLGSYNAGVLGNAEYPFIALAPRSTLVWSDSI